MRRALRWGIPIFVVLVLLYGLDFEDVEFDSRKGDVPLKVWYIPGDGEEPTLSFVHGIGASARGRTWWSWPNG